MPIYWGTLAWLYGLSGVLGVYVMGYRGMSPGVDGLGYGFLPLQVQGADLEREGWHSRWVKMKLGEGAAGG
ncbi:hypothetical protein B0T18DRAFT_417472 [Schizothecium vesticola]|uniref:Uncharacterized protein n=1 Tax=Schizothecium vesticola TaxID=314040 RepID=A0AA40JYY6_9PEZI|nr:hypothetical protein B0T18DRAFT_417472 [Schizothecium vesticola]